MAIVRPGHLLKLFKNLLVMMRLAVLMMMVTVITTSTTMTSTWVMMTITHMRRRGYTPTHPFPIRIDLEHQNTVKVRELSPAYQGQGEGITRILSYETTTIMTPTITIIILITRSCSPG